MTGDTTSPDMPLALGRHHLAANRRMIIGRALAAAAAGLVPIPVVEEWLVSTVRRGTIKRIAAARGVDLDAAALAVLADGKSTAPDFKRLAASTLLFRLLEQRWRKLLATYVAGRRARDAGQAFLIATLFDHYCARLHVGLGLDGAAGAAVRAAIEASLAAVPGGLGKHLFRRGIVGAAKAAVRAPVEVLDIASGGLVRRMLRRGDEVEAVEEVEGALERSLAAERGLLGRAAAAVEVQLSADHNDYLERLLADFENRWRARGAAT